MLGAAMEILALVCPKCGAPLPLDLGAHPRCAFCGIGVVLRTGTVHTTGDASAAPHVPLDPESFFEAIHAALKAGRSPFDAVREAAGEHLGALGESDAIARITLALAREVEGESGASVQNDGNVLARIAQAYVKALPELRDKGTSEVNLPFLAATEKGPIHLSRRLTPASISDLLSPKPKKCEPVKAPSEPREKKRGWWPFGR
jgi:hypothetical protein